MDDANQMVVVTVRMSKKTLNDAQIVLSAIRCDGNNDLTLDNYIEGAVVAATNTRLGLKEMPAMLKDLKKRIDNLLPKETT